MKKILVVVDMQNDFISGSLGTKEAEHIVENVVNKIANFDGDIYATMDTHHDNYLETLEGRKLPIEHCFIWHEGWEFHEKIEEVLENKKYFRILKNTFGSEILPDKITEYIWNKNIKQSELEIELIGLCTDICVVSNALILRACFPNVEITVDASCCAGTTPEKHRAALETMKSCMINVIGEDEQ
jgi:nicotinamidase-related amidase